MTTGADIIYYLERMIKVVLMAMPVNIFCACQVNHLRKDNMQQPRLKQQVKTNGRFFRQQYFVQLVCNALLRDDLNSFYIVLYPPERIFFYPEFKLCCKTYTPEHAQRVITKCIVWLQWRFNYSILQVLQAFERIVYFSVIRFVKTNRKGVNGKVPAHLVVV